MEFEIQLTYKDFYHFLFSRTYDTFSVRLSLAVGLASILASLYAIFQLGAAQAAGLTLLGIAFLLWNPVLLCIRAGKLLAASGPVWHLRYSFTEEGMRIAPPDQKPGFVPWSAMGGVFCTKKQIILYKDPEHAYILPKRQLDSPEALAAWLKEHIR